MQRWRALLPQRIDPKDLTQARLKRLRPTPNAPARLLPVLAPWLRCDRYRPKRQRPNQSVNHARIAGHKNRTQAN